MQQRSLIRTPLWLALSLAVSMAAHAQGTEQKAREMDAVVVTASPLKEDSEALMAPVSVLAGDVLDDRRAGTIGETVAALPGVQSSFFGVGVGRPIIRGLDANRVSVLSGGLSSMDVSTISADHAVTVDPFIAEQIEVIKGPASLLYGSGAIGGVVNVVDGRIPLQAKEGVSGRISLSADSVADARGGAFRVDHGSGLGWNLHADGFWRDSEDYEIPVDALAKDGEDEGKLENSAVETKGAALGGSWQGDDVHFGLAVSNFQSEYGVPAGEEEDADEAENDRVAKARLVALPAKGGEGGVVLDIDQTRVDVEAGWKAPTAGIESATLKLARNDYEHVEIEGSGEIGTLFDNREFDARMELVHGTWNAWNGAFGLTLNDRDFSAIGEEAFVPPTSSRSYGAFLVEQREIDAVTLELGARFDRNRLSSPDTRRSFSLFSVSAGARADLGNAFSLGLLLDHAQRAPSAEELFADGPHVATGIFEIGDADLREETARQIEVEVRYEGEHLHLHASIYRNDFQDFIYLAATEDEEDGLPVGVWTQDDVRFNGYEVGGEWDLAETRFGSFTLDALADSVRAEREGDGASLPRIAPRRFGVGVGYAFGAWRARLGYQKYAKQDDVASFETVTDGFSDTSLNISYSMNVADSELEWFVQGRNLSDNEIRLHTSFLKDVAPLPGRNVSAGVRWYF